MTTPTNTPPNTPTQRFPLQVALPLARELARSLLPGASRLSVVGSIRRQTETVHDIEIVIEPIIKTLQATMFTSQPAPIIKRNELFEILSQLLASKQIPFPWKMGKKDGPKLKTLTHIDTGITAELYIVYDPRSWGSHKLIRTGPTDYSKWIVTRAIEHSMHFAHGFLLHDHPRQWSSEKESYTDCPDGHLCPHIIPLPDERATYTALGLSYKPPKERGHQ